MGSQSHSVDINISPLLGDVTVILPKFVHAVGGCTQIW